MSIKFVSKKEIKKLIKKKIEPAKIILDIGCGINPQRLINPKIHICIEPYLEYIKKSMMINPFKNYVYLNSTWEKALKLFPEKSIDSIFMIDFIEHIEKDDGFKLLPQCERIAKKQVVIFTPLGFIPQENIEGRKDRWGMDGGAYQEHKSGWNVEDFDETWDLFCVKEYHFDDGYGNNYDEPYGIIWAIKNIRRTEDEPPKLDYFIYSLKRKIPTSIKKILKKLFL